MSLFAIDSTDNNKTNIEFCFRSICIYICQLKKVSQAGSMRLFSWQISMRIELNKMQYLLNVFDQPCIK